MKTGREGACEGEKIVTKGGEEDGLNRGEAAVAVDD